jgi:hypothetical protein
MYHIILLDADPSAYSTAVGTWVLAGITFLAVFVQALFNRKTIGDANKNAKEQFDLTRKGLQDANDSSYKYTSLKIVDSFDKKFEEIYEDRQALAKAIIDNNLLDKKDFDYSLIKGLPDEIYDIFDTLGYFVEHKYIRIDAVHQYFNYWFSRYFRFFTLYHIASKAGFESTVWNNLPTLSEEMDQEEIRQKGITVDKIDKDELLRFFKEEGGFFDEGLGTS